MASFNLLEIYKGRSAQIKMGRSAFATDKSLLESTLCLKANITTDILNCLLRFTVPSLATLG